MSTQNRSKINQLFHLQPPCTVLTSKWLGKQGYSLELLKRYRKSHWLESIGSGAMIKSSESVDYTGGLYALQNQLDLSVHPGGKTALNLLGKAHFLEFSTEVITLFAPSGERLPKWFKNHKWGIEFNYFTSSFLPSVLGLSTVELKFFNLEVSSAERAIFECIYLIPQNQDIVECYEILLGLSDLRPKLLQQLLEKCTSIKTKRLFLYLAHKCDHPWFKYLNIDELDLGKGKRSLVDNGVYISRYKITVPKELEQKG